MGKPVELFYPRFYRVNPDNGNPEWYMANPSNPAEPQADPSRVTDDPTIRDAQAQSLGKPRYAPYQGSFGVSANLWGAYLQADFIFQLDKWMMSNDKYYFENPLLFQERNQSRRITRDSFWKKPGDRATYPGLHVKEWMSLDSRTLQNASFLRLKNLTVGYQFPKSWLERTKILTGAKLYLSFRNILTVTKFDGVDPEPNLHLTLGANPNTKQYSVGVELQF